MLHKPSGAHSSLQLSHLHLIASAALLLSLSASSMVSSIPWRRRCRRRRRGVMCARYPAGTVSQSRTRAGMSASRRRSCPERSGAAPLLPFDHLLFLQDSGLGRGAARVLSARARRRSCHLSIFFFNRLVRTQYKMLWKALVRGIPAHFVLGSDEMIEERCW